ncbi:MBL fold metallo-hydrolase [Longirhabdus pacifica]|uniref:MBL fold metallo-hydrolase n=1 Tax=Longirhabdus pacifica TaxID=2305227 RepID=UPI0013E8ECA7|nr:integrator complex subunit 9 [Longirhabdus pacifica]
MKAEVWGGAGEHGRSCYYVEHQDMAVLLDCGGKKEAAGVYPLLDKTKVNKITAVFLSHAHEDHGVALPLLYELGYAGDVWTTKATYEQLPYYFKAWKSFVEQRGGTVPYAEETTKEITFRFLEDEAPMGEAISITKDIQVTWGASGHMLGSIWLQLHIAGKNVFYSGDYSPESTLLTVDPPSFPTTPDLAIIDAAYGIDTTSQQDLLNVLQDKVAEVLARKGHVLMPVPVFGRSQELWMMFVKRFPQANIAVEKEIAEGLLYWKRWGNWVREDVLMDNRLMKERMTIVSKDEERRELLMKTPHIIFVPGGMMESKISQWYDKQLRNDERNAVLLTGHAAADTYAATLLKHHHGCEVASFRYKIHQGYFDVRHMLNHLQPHITILAHANKAKTDHLADLLHENGYNGLLSLQPGDCINVS